MFRQPLSTLTMQPCLTWLPTNMAANKHFVSIHNTLVGYGNSGSSFVNISTTWLRLCRAASCNAVSRSPLIILDIILALVTLLSRSEGRAFVRSMRCSTTLEWPYLAAKWRGVCPLLLAWNNSGGHLSRNLSTKSVNPGSLLWFLKQT